MGGIVMTKASALAPYTRVNDRKFRDEFKARAALAGHPAGAAGISDEARAALVREFGEDAATAESFIINALPGEEIDGVIPNKLSDRVSQHGVTEYRVLTREGECLFYAKLVSEREAGLVARNGDIGPSESILLPGRKILLMKGFEGVPMVGLSAGELERNAWIFERLGAYLRTLIRRDFVIWPVEAKHVYVDFRRQRVNITDHGETELLNDASQVPGWKLDIMESQVCGFIDALHGGRTLEEPAKERLKEEFRTAFHAQANPDIENALQALEALLPGREKKDGGKCYTIRYNTLKIPQGSSAERLLTVYVEEFLPRKMPGEDRFRLRASKAERQSLISVECYKDRERSERVGECHVDVGEDVNGRALRIIGMMNMAILASHIPNNISADRMDEYSRIISFLKAQCREIAGDAIPIEEALKDTSHGIRITLPRPEPIPLNRVEEYYRLTIEQLERAA